MCLGSPCCTAIMSPLFPCSLHSGQGQSLSPSSADGDRGTEFGIVHETGGRERVWESPPFQGCGLGIHRDSFLRIAGVCASCLSFPTH